MGNNDRTPRLTGLKLAVLMVEEQAAGAAAKAAFQL
jgi:hypothetical protein